MASCNDTSQLYCEPTEGETLTDNQTVELEYNPEFELLNGSAAVDVFLYHADTSTLAESILDIPNTGNMSFTINSV
jgi:hypothetical protein